MKVKAKTKFKINYVIAVQTRKTFYLKNLIAMKLMKIIINTVYFYLSLI